MVYSYIYSHFWTLCIVLSLVNTTFQSLDSVSFFRWNLLSRTQLISVSLSPEVFQRSQCHRFFPGYVRCLVVLIFQTYIESSSKTSYSRQGKFGPCTETEISSWTQMRRFHLKTGTESSLRNIVLKYKTGQWILSRILRVKCDVEFKPS
jgi:hypothetical protein